jgi:hypothetical protein
MEQCNFRFIDLLDSSSRLDFYYESNGVGLILEQKIFRDVSAWYHFVVVA